MRSFVVRREAELVNDFRYFLVPSIGVVAHVIEARGSAQIKDKRLALIH